MLGVKTLDEAGRFIKLHLPGGHDEFVAFDGGEHMFPIILGL